MPFIGNQPADKFLTLEKQVFTTSATATYTLDREVSSVNDLELFLNNVRQEPTTAYTISGTTLTLASAITSSDSMYCIYQGRAVGTQAPANGSVTNAMLATPTTINNNADNRVITGSGTTNTLEGEANFAYDGTNVIIGSDTTDTSGIGGTFTALNIRAGSGYPAIYGQTTATATNKTALNLVGATSGASAGGAGELLGAIEIACQSDSSTNATGLMRFYTGSGGGLTERMKIDASGDLFVQGVYDNPTSGGGNVRVQSNGLMQRDTSSRRYKNSINDATHGLTELLTLRPVTYKGNNDGDTVFGGLIAEEVHDAGLTEFVDYDDQNRPDAIKYANMVSLCIKAIQELKEELDEAKARIATLEGN